MIEHAGLDTGLDNLISLICPKCQPTVRFKPSQGQRIVEHIGAHVLHDPSVDRFSEPCGLCLRPAPLCKIVLRKAKGKTGKFAIDVDASSCPNIVKFSIGVAAECSNSSPCTNHPIVCSYCDDSGSGRIVWSYNFRAHLLCEHPRLPLKEYGDILTPKKLEKDRMKHVWGRRLKQPKVHRKSQRAPLVISQTHRSRLILKYVCLFCFTNDSTDAQNSL